MIPTPQDTLPIPVRVLMPPGAVVLPAAMARRGSRARRAAAGSIGPSGTRVVLWDTRFRSRRGLCRSAERLGVDVERSCIVLPSWGRATFAADDAGQTVAWLLRSMATVPPGLARGVWLADMAVRLARVSWVARLIARRPPARIVIGTWR